LFRNCDARSSPNENITTCVPYKFVLVFGDPAPDDKKSVTALCKSPLALVVAARASAATDIRIHLIALPECYAGKALGE
jgi:hypothetical protein